MTLSFYILYYSSLTDSNIILNSMWIIDHLHHKCVYIIIYDSYYVWYIVLYQFISLFIMYNNYLNQVKTNGKIEGFLEILI